MIDNPLLSDIRQQLELHPEGISEYELLCALANHPALLAIDADPDLALFQKHFLLMNGLYQLQDILWQSRGEILRISPLKLKIDTARAASAQALAEARSPELRDYYLDWNNFSETGSEDVAGLLSNFWRDYKRYFSRDEALDSLGLATGASRDEITARYRELAAKHHPDRGGDAKLFISIRAAYESLIK